VSQTRRLTNLRSELLITSNFEMLALRHWSVTHSRSLEWIYARLESLLFLLRPLFRLIGYARLETPVSITEKSIKGLLFDCQMCGECVLSSTGMSCPMNCPKQLRNGPCGGVRPNGNCEIKTDIPCVWVQAWRGSQQMREGNNILSLQTLLDRRLQGRSSWLAVTQKQGPSE
jgi:Methylene-tetrahydrofolate reductase C terminal